jgi:hypothetical protein
MYNTNFTIEDLEKAFKDLSEAEARREPERKFVVYSGTTKIYNRDSKTGRFKGGYRYGSRFEEMMNKEMERLGALHNTPIEVKVVSNHRVNGIEDRDVSEALKFLNNGEESKD